MSNKGSPFERALCKLLSLWWTHNKSDDVFWRTSGSGARAKTRGKKGLSTFGQYGDMQATDPKGQPFIDVCNVEIKRGYSGSTFANLIDKREVSAKQMWEKFIQQAVTDNHYSHSYTWMLIAKRDAKETVIFIPIRFYKRLQKMGCHLQKIIPCVYMRCKIWDGSVRAIYGTTLDVFLKEVTPKHIKKIHRSLGTK